MKHQSAIDSHVVQSMGRTIEVLHCQSSQYISNYRDMVLSALIGALTVILVPYIHLGIIYTWIWTPHKRSVNKNNCTCSCFDTIFKGSYEEPGSTTYKHVYFNCTWQTFIIWIFTIISIVMAYESMKYLISLIRRRKYRASMVALYIINWYPHYYSWWVFFGYYNDEFYAFLKHQYFFSVTEIITTCVVLSLCDVNNELVSWKVLLIVSISVMHILVGGMDQFIENVIFGRGAMFKKTRDMGLMIPDCLHVVIPLRMLYTTAQKKKLKINQMLVFYKKEILMSILFVFIGTLVGRRL